MKTLDKKLKECREIRGMTQLEVCEQTGISRRALIAYENGQNKPRSEKIEKLAKLYRVSVKYLTDDSCGDIEEGLETDPYVSEIRHKYGNKDALEVEKLLLGTTALFAGGTLSQEDKDKYFESVMKTYLLCKEKAKDKYGKKADK